MLGLQEQIDQAIQEHRYTDIPDLEDAIITERAAPTRFGSHRKKMV